MEMNERKRKILHAIINEYVTSAEPVGSRHIAKNLDLGLSSATIRNEMADLEDMAYLEQPHTSAGRLPTDKAYRLYVDDLMQKQILDENIFSHTYAPHDRPPLRSMLKAPKQVKIMQLKIFSFPL